MHYSFNPIIDHLHKNTKHANLPQEQWRMNLTLESIKILIYNVISTDFRQLPQDFNTVVLTLITVGQFKKKFGQLFPC